MDVKVSIAAIKDAITKSAAERTSPEVISAAYAVVHLIGGVAACVGAPSRRSRAIRHGCGGGVGCRAERRCSPHRRCYRLHNKLRPCRQHTLSCRYRTCLHDKLCVSGHKACVKKRVRACNRRQFPRCQPAFFRASPRCSLRHRQRLSC